tara:strand:+ start:5712 stop:5930 length:219 start_codon:yes stop_codon:yes gene_type:complete
MAIKKVFAKWHSRKWQVFIIATILFILGPIIDIAWVPVWAWVTISTAYVGSEAYVDRSHKMAQVLKPNVDGN